MLQSSLELEALDLEEGTGKCMTSGRPNLGKEHPEHKLTDPETERHRKRILYFPS